MYWALTTDLVDTRGFRFEQVLAEIQTLNHWARAARLEVTAIEASPPAKIGAMVESAPTDMKRLAPSIAKAWSPPARLLPPAVSPAW